MKASYQWYAKFIKKPIEGFKRGCDRSLQRNSSFWILLRFYASGNNASYRLPSNQALREELEVYSYKRRLPVHPSYRGPVERTSDVGRGHGSRPIKYPNTVHDETPAAMQDGGPPIAVKCGNGIIRCIERFRYILTDRYPNFFPRCVPWFQECVS